MALRVNIRSYLKKVFWPQSLCWYLGLNPRNTEVFLRFKTQVRLELEPKSYF